MARFRYCHNGTESQKRNGISFQIETCAALRIEVTEALATLAHPNENKCSPLAASRILGV